MARSDHSGDSTGRTVATSTTAAAVDSDRNAGGHHRTDGTGTATTTGAVASGSEQTETAPTQDTGVEEAVLSLSQITKEYGAECAVDGLSLSVQRGELLTLLGPSGCGKTTTLRLIAGLERPDQGSITLAGRPVADDQEWTPPERRDVGVVFQDFALFPHMTAAENIAFGIDDWDSEARSQRVDELLELVGLNQQANSLPEELSGGQQQRIALARALAPEPEVLLLDEPFSNLDVDLRVRMREEVRKILKQAGVTGIFVTHDQEEALSISDRIAVMHEGNIEQVGHPETVFQHPTSRFVAGFLGHASFVGGQYSGNRVETAIGPIRQDQVHGLTDEYRGSTIDVLVRPDDLVATPVPPETADGTVTYRRYLGPTVLYRVELDTGETVECMHNHADEIDLGSSVEVRLSAAHDLAWFPQEHAPSANSPGN